MVQKDIKFKVGLSTEYLAVTFWGKQKAPVNMDLDEEHL